MTRITSNPAAAAPNVTSTDDQRLRAVAKQLEGVFVQQLFKAMRETVPKDGVTDGGAGEEIFTGMMDETMATHVPEQWDRGIGESLYRQLRAALPPQANPGAAPADADAKRTT
jgi:peptidoglycan hydrolase FlgJ